MTLMIIATAALVWLAINNMLAFRVLADQNETIIRTLSRIENLLEPEHRSSPLSE